MSSDALPFDGFAIRIRHLCKHYMMYARPEDRLKQSVIPRLQRFAGQPPTQYYRDFAALTGVSFEVGQGETVGIVGRNGSGKSTLLQLICGTLRPTSGTVEVRGRIAALLELGAGFNPEFTGRENVYMNAAILGLSTAETDSRFDAIAAFADIGPFLDQPVKSYSSGMFVRLAFAVATNVDPDILVVDEALAVGDEAFQRKCFARIEQIKARGGTILFVSHGAQTILQLCDRAILMDGGEKLLDGRPKTVLNQYHRLVNASAAAAPAVRASIAAQSEKQDRGEAKGGQSATLPGEAEPSDSERGDSERGDSERGDSNKGGVLGHAATAGHDTTTDYNPALVSESTAYMEERGARLGAIRITTLDGRTVNQLNGGAQYKLCFTVEFIEALPNIGFGFSIRNPAGVILAGCATDHVKAKVIAGAKAGSMAAVNFTFTNSFTPGLYFVSVGILSTNEEGRNFAHRAGDAIVFRVRNEPDNMAGGYFDIGAFEQVEWIDRASDGASEGV